MCQHQIDWVWFKFWMKNVFSPAWDGTSGLEVGKDGSWASQVLSLWTFTISTFISKLNQYEYQCQDCLFCREAHQAEVGRAKEVEEQLAEAYRFFQIIILIMIMIVTTMICFCVMMLTMRMRTTMIFWTSGNGLRWPGNVLRRKRRWTNNNNMCEPIPITIANQ